MTPRPQFLPATARHAYLTMPGSIVNYCGRPEVVLAPYYLIRERIGSEPAASDIELPTSGFATTRSATNAILLFLTPEVIVAQ